MNLFGVLGNARGQRSLASGAVPRRRVKRLPAERLAAARLAGILLLLDDASPPALRRQLDGDDPQHVSAARQPRHARELPIARMTGLPCRGHVLRVVTVQLTADCSGG